MIVFRLLKGEIFSFLSIKLIILIFKRDHLFRSFDFTNR